MPSYTSIARVYDLEPMVGSASDLTSAQLISAFIDPTEGEMNAVLARRYAVPVTGTIPILQGIADDLTVYRCLRRIFSQDQLKDSVWPNAFKEARERLNAIGDGKILLVDSAGALVAQRTTISQARSNTQGYMPTFHEGGSWMDQIKDADRNDDELSARDL